MVMVEQMRLFSDADTSHVLGAFCVRRVNHLTASSFVENWHYSKIMPTGLNYNYGLYHSGVLYAVIVYGIGVNPHQEEFLKCGRVMEIKRMCRTEPRKDDYPLSKFIAVSSKALRQCVPFDCLLAFADPEHGHHGGVYKASGFVLHGTTNGEYHLKDSDGNTYHRRLAYRHSRRHGISIAESRNRLGLEKIKTMPKNRWIKMHNKW